MTPLKSDRLLAMFVPPRRGDISARGWTGLLRFFRIFRGPARAAVGLLFFAAIALGAQPEPARAQTDAETATYTVTFKGNWNTQSTPGGVVGSAHFTTLIGAVHNSDVTFWESGGTATAGVELVAEIGGTSTFRTEISDAEEGTVKSTVSKSGVGATGSRTFELEFSRTHPLLTLLSMIGPSPDWFVGVSGLSLLDGSNWRSSLTRDLFAYDAGTEDGENFSLSNADTNPQEPITSLRDMGKFSDVRMARLTFTLKTPPQNNAPEFSDTSTTRSFTETVGDATVQSAGDIGTAVTATDDDNDMLTYSLEGTDARKFMIVSGSGQIQTKAGESYDREAEASYSVTVKADDQNEGTDTIAVTVNVDNATEKPLAPAAPLVSSGSTSTTSVNVMWTSPENAGRPSITSYDLQYREGMTGNWMDGPQGVTGTSSTIMNLMEDTEYQVQVRARNSDGESTWSDPGTGRTNARGNTSPEFTEGMNATRSFTETVGDATVQSAGDVGAAVSATDQDNGALTYTLGGADKDSFAIDSGTGQIETKVGESYDRETKASYLVMVMADDQNGGTDTIAVTINVTDQMEKPLAPAAPSVSSSSTTSVNVTWSAPSNTGRPEITSYDLQYKKSSETNWSDGPQDVTATSMSMSTSIGDLDENTEYQVQILASNSDGDSPWSQTGTGRTDVQSNRAPAPPPSPPLPPPSTEAAQVDTDSELREFVGDAGKRIETSDTFEETLRLLEEFRDSEGGWNNGSMYLILLTKRGGVYFHANDREVEDLDWSGVLFCEEGGSVLDTREGCLITNGGYAHPFSASHVPLAHGEEEFVLLGGFDETPEGKPFTGVLDEPSTEAGDVDTDRELREFVGHAGRALMGAIVNSEIDPAELRGILRREGLWREGDVYIYIMDEMGRVIFDGADRGREQKNEYAKQYVRDLIAGAGGRIVEYREDGFIRGYAVRVEAPLDGDEASRVYVVGSGYPVDEPPSGSGGGCAVGGSGSDGTFGLFMAALALLLAVSLKSGTVLSGIGRYSGSATKPSSLPKPNK